MRGEGSLVDVKKKLTNLPLDTLLQTARRAGQNAAANAVAAGRHVVSHHDAEVAELRADRELAVEYLKVAMESLDNPDDRAAGLLALRTVAEAYGGLGAAAAEPLYQIVSASVPANVKAEVSAILASKGISMTALLRVFLGRVAANDKQTLAWLKEGTPQKTEKIVR